MNEKLWGKWQKGRNFNGAKQDLRLIYVPLPALKAVLSFFSVSPCIRGRKEPTFWKNYCLWARNSSFIVLKNDVKAQEEFVA
jgi:hypothetical protein